MSEPPAVLLCHAKPTSLSVDHEAVSLAQSESEVLTCIASSVSTDATSLAEEECKSSLGQITSADHEVVVCHLCQVLTIELAWGPCWNECGQ